MQDIDGRLNGNHIDRKTMYKQHMEKIMNDENDWDQITNADVALGQIQRVTHV